MSRNALLFAVLVLLAGCTPNTPEPPPPPPVAPVPSLPVDPVKPPMVNPASLQGDADKPAPRPVDPAAAPQVSSDELIKQLEKSEDRQAAAAALAAQGKEAIPALAQARDHNDWQVRAAAVFALGKIGKDAASAKDKLQAIAEKDENEEVRVAAAFALDAMAE